MFSVIVRSTLSVYDFFYTFATFIYCDPMGSYMTCILVVLFVDVARPLSIKSDPWSPFDKKFVFVTLIVAYLVVNVLQREYSGAFENEHGTLQCQWMQLNTLYLKLHFSSLLISALFSPFAVISPGGRGQFSPVFPVFNTPPAAFVQCLFHPWLIPLSFCVFISASPSIFSLSLFPNLLQLAYFN